MQYTIELILQKLVVVRPRLLDWLVKAFREVQKVGLHVFEVLVFLAHHDLVLLAKQLLGVLHSGVVQRSHRLFSFLIHLAVRQIQALYFLLKQPDFFALILDLVAHLLDYFGVIQLDKFLRLCFDFLLVGFAERVLVRRFVLAVGFGEDVDFGENARL